MIFNLVAGRPIHIFNYVITAFIKDHLREKREDVIFKEGPGFLLLVELTEAVDLIDRAAHYQVGISDDAGKLHLRFRHCSCFGGEIGIMFAQA